MCLCVRTGVCERMKGFVCESIKCGAWTLVHVLISVSVEEIKKTKINILVLNRKNSFLPNLTRLLKSMQSESNGLFILGAGLRPQFFNPNKITPKMFLLTVIVLVMSIMIHERF